MFSGANSPFTDPTFRPSGWRPTVWREIPVTHWISVSSEFPSLKMDRRIGCESLLESDMACLLEVDSHVISYREQPVGPDWHDGYGWTAGTARDFWVVTTEGPYLLEVKSATELADPEVRDRFRRMRASYHLHGIRLVVRSEATIRLQPRLDNSKLIIRHAHEIDDAMDLALSDVRAATKEPVSIAALKRHLGPRLEKRVFGSVCRFVFTDRAIINIDAPLNEEAVVQWVR